jgi:1,4-alpha-glucan branching enzyme
MTHAALADLLASWLPAQRWFAGNGTEIRDLAITSDVVLATDPELRHLIVAIGTGADVVSYQVLVGFRSDLPPALAQAVIGSAGDGRIAYDALRDPELTSVLLRAIAGQRLAGPIRFTARTGAVIDGTADARTLGADQSNTSIVYGDRAILKVLRRPSPGRHPDLELPGALAANGSSLVAAPLGWIEMPGDSGQSGGPAQADVPAQASRPAQADGPALADVPAQASGAAPASGAVEPTVLAILSEYFAGAADGWSLALASLSAPDPDFAGEAHLLGRATARLHAELATAFGTEPLSRQALIDLTRGMNAELDLAVAEVPELRPYQARLRACYSELTELTGAARTQRIHGDYHLGQVLGTDDGWVVLDFEGEPSVPLTQRRAHALALRDVAGMLRSFDYAARHQLLDGSADQEFGEKMLDWASSCADAFCAGYAEASGTDPRASGVLLRALTYQKAVYEAVYEARHRPGWLPIPLSAIAEASVMTGTAKPADQPESSEPVSTPQSAGPQEPAEPPAPASPQEPAAPASPSVPAVDPVSPDEIIAILAGQHYDPHAVLGVHPGPDGPIVRALRPLARAVAVLLPDGTRYPMRHLHEGIFSVTLPVETIDDYRLAVGYSADGPELIIDDPYRHLPTLGEMDLHLIAEGRHEELWRALGARVRPHLEGTSFAVWAPNATGVRLIGDFNHWDGRTHPMRSLGSSGVWELFVPGVGTGARYKFEIRGRDGNWRRKADPMAMFAQEPPATASVVFESGYRWADQRWMTARANSDPLREPMSIYEVHIGSWRPGLSYRELADDLVTYVLDRGFTHVEFMPVAEHPYGGSWGYQVTSFYAPTARFGTPDDFRHLVDRLHQAGIGVFADWVPAHFATDEWALGRFDGTPLYEHADPRRGEHPDWGTLIFDFGRPEVRNFLVANAVYWLEEFHIDGLRVDGVASMLYLDYSRAPGQWTPNVLGGRENLDAVSFLQEVNATCYKRSAGIVMIAEESTAWPGVTRPVHLGGLGFALKWNMGWMHDTLSYLAHDPIFRHYHHNELTFSMMYAYSENFVLPLSHDEVVHGKGSLLRKMPGDTCKRFAALRALLGYMWAHPGKQLLFMGSEFGQETEWSEQHGLDWAALSDPAHAGLRGLVDDLNRAYTGLPALWREDFSPAGFSWIDANDAIGNVVSFLRSADGEPAVACVANFSGDPHSEYRIGLPTTGHWRELINTDAEVYGGSGVGNLGSVKSVAEPWHGRPASAVLTIPPLAVLWLALDERSAGPAR